MRTRGNQRGGFSLMELLLVVTILAITIAAVILYLDPIARGRAANNARRLQDVNGIADALVLFKHDSPAEFAAATQLLNDNYFMLVNTTEAELDGGNPSACLSPSTIECLGLQGTQLAGCISTEGLKKYLGAPLDDPDDEYGAKDGLSGYYFTYRDRMFIVGACLTDPEPDGTLPSIQALR